MSLKRPAGRIVIALYRAAGAGLAIGMMELLARIADEPLARVPFVTSIVLVMALPDSEAARPRSLILGHMISCMAGLAAKFVCGTGQTASAVGIALATLTMIASDTLHPPAGIDAFLLATQDLPERWLVSPVLIGALLLAGFARAWAFGERRWLRPR